jgi:hypothetical protein
MIYITIDGDDIGQKITSAYLKNDMAKLIKINEIVNKKTELIASHLNSKGFDIIFCAADGVAAYSKDENNDMAAIFDAIQAIGACDINFSAGVGDDLRKAYIALLSAKSSGKGRLHKFEDIGNNV